MDNRRYFVWFGSFFLFIGTILLIQGAIQYRRRELYRHQWIEAQATVVRKWIVPATRTGALASEYRLQYRLQPPGHPPNTRVVLLDPEDWEPIREGASIPILYPHAAPQQSRLPSEGEPPSGLGELAGGLCAALFGGTLAGWNLARLRESRSPLIQRFPILQTLRNGAAWTLRLAVAILFIAIAENIPTLQRLTEAIAIHQPFYVSIAVFVMIAGGALLAFSPTRRRIAMATLILGILGLIFAVGPAFVKAGVVLTRISHR
ncbi:MAG: DUF3592 domain-containing protein [Bryobacterales bacterium]|nr:DUF3592 domain-containing protein [Bryobacterales bacterium]